MSHKPPYRTSVTTNARVPSDSSSVASDSAYSSVSVSSSYRHHANGPFMIDQPKPVLTHDKHHQPKTTGSVGLMIAGLGGANGTTLLAGIAAHRLKVQWHGPTGEVKTPNYYGCVTQLNMRGGGVGYKDRVKGLADATLAAIGGWDIRPTRAGDALLQAQILDYDLVRQVQNEMNKTKIFRGYYDPRFIGTSQHETATHILTTQEAPSTAEALKCLRADIRYFKWRNGVVGHTTVLWSASVEPNCDLVEELTTAQDLLDAIEMSEEQRGGPLPPSLLYATAALLEGCSFINGGSQNTLSCVGLMDLAKQQTGVYCLGTDFKAGQTKFKTAAVEYLRTMGLKPKVIASSNHLGNNDMRNLATAKSASTAKLRVKHDIFAPWEEDDLDHKVSIMFTEYINDDKRDFVEYTSLGFMGHPHTMVTYTRASDSVLCVPLMIDGAVWCDYFSSRSWPFDKVAKALAYLFKVPEGAAKGVDPGFFRQMQELDTQVMTAHQTKSGMKSSEAKKRVRIRPDEKATEWAIPHNARVVCAGLACVDMQLCHATGGYGGEGIETFEGATSIGGGSVAMACKTLARLFHGAPLDEAYMEVSPPVVNSVIPLCKVGQDDTGDKLIVLLEKCGEACRNVETRYLKSARARDPNARTALSVLPIFRDGRRGCFFDAASNTTFSARELITMLNSLSWGSSGRSLNTSSMSADDIENFHADLEQHTPILGAFLFGYPHLMPQMQGDALAQILLEARSNMPDGGITAVDLNGVPEGTFSLQVDGLRSVTSLRSDSVLGPALEHIDILHMNEEELCLLTGCTFRATADSVQEDNIVMLKAANLFLLCGVAIVLVTRGKQGCLVCCNDADRFRRSPALPISWADCTSKVGSFHFPKGTIINSNGAGDAFTSGFLVAAMLRHTGMTLPVKEDGERSVNNSIDSPPVTSPTQPKPVKKLSPYALYMQEHYVSLKAQLKGDKRAIFSRCHEMWESERADVKALYERRAQEENDDLEESGENSMLSMMSDMDHMDSGSKITTSYHIDALGTPRNTYMTNRSLNLDSAVHFATLIAARHIDVSTREQQHIDVSHLIERAVAFPSSMKEI